MNAWLITWEGTDSRINNKNKIVAILSGKRSQSFVEDLIDFIYLRFTQSAHGMAYFANRPRERRHKNKPNFSNGGRIFYGANPYLYGRQVTDISVTQRTDENIEIISWVELPYYRQNPDKNYELEMIEPEIRKELLRPTTDPLGVELGA